MLRSLLLLTLLINSYTLVSQAETINSIVARVESQTITQFDLKNSTEKKLDQEIFNKLIKLEAKRYGLATNEDEINFYLDQIAINQKLTANEFMAQQKKAGKSAQTTREELQLEILKQKLALKLFQNSKARLSEGRDSPVHNKLNLSQILLDIDKHGEEKAQSLADQVIEKYDQGMTFELLVQDFSDAANKEDKGNLGVLSWNDLDQKFRQEISQIEPGNLTKPIRKGPFLFIFKLNEWVQDEEDKKGTGDPQLSDQEMNQLLTEYFQKELYQKYLVEKK